MRGKVAMALAVAFLLTPLATRGQKSKEKSQLEFTQRFLLLPSRQYDIEEAAAFGYRLLFRSPPSSDLPVVVMERAAPPPDAYRYLLIGVRGNLAEQLIVDLLTFRRQPTARENLEMKLNEAAVQDFRLLPHTVIVKQNPSEPGPMQMGPAPVAATIEAVMEIRPGPVTHYQYRILSNVPRGFVIMAPSEFEKRMRQTAQEGFLPVALVPDNQTVILERPTPPPDKPLAMPPPDSKPDEKPPYVWLSANTTAGLQKDLQEAAREGYRFGAISTHGNELVAVMEKVTQPPVTQEYLLLATTKMSTLQKELNEAGGRGLRLLRRSLISRKPPKGMVSFYGGLVRGVVTDEIVALMEKAPGSSNRYQYQILQTMRFSTLQKELAHAMEQGFAVVGGVAGTQYTALLEKPI